MRTIALQTCIMIKKILAVVCCLFAIKAPAQVEQPHYLSTTASLSARTTPAWYGNAKLGIFIHWGLYSVPAWATPSTTPDKVTDWPKFYRNNPYAEWYLNTLRIKGSPAEKHHNDTYGAGYDYYNFKDSLLQKTKSWQAQSWAGAIKQTGARYVVFTSKHHDGYTLYPSNVPHPLLRADEIKSPRNYVGELASAVRAVGLKFGVYYSGGLDWSFYQSPITNLWPDLFESMPKSVAYTAYADAQVYELIHRYKPDLLWNDVNYPKNGDVLGIFAELFNLNPDAVVNDRWQQAPELTDFSTPEYTVLDSISKKKWETCRGIGYSFGYNQVETDAQLLQPQALIHLLIDVVSKNGNLLLNIGPAGDGTIPANQLTRLQALGNWMQMYSEGIYDTKPWRVAAAVLPDGTDIRFTKKEATLYAFLLQQPKSNTIVLPHCNTTAASEVVLIGGPNVKLKYKQTAEGLRIELPQRYNFNHAALIRITPVL